MYYQYEKNYKHILFSTPSKKKNNLKKSPHFNNIRISFFTHSVHFKVTGYSSFQN